MSVDFNIKCAFAVPSGDDKGVLSSSNNKGLTEGQGDGVWGATQHKPQPQPSRQTSGRKQHLLSYELNTLSIVLEELFCRICHEGGGAEQLLSPCECSGSLASVHRSCLERWLTASSTGRCELCRFEFALERQPRPLTEWLHAPSMRYQRRTLCGDALCFTFITPLASLSGWLCVRGAVDLYHSSSMEAAGLLVLTAALLVIYLFWTTVSLRYHVHLFEMWRQTNQQVRLQIPQPEGLPCGRLEPPPRPSSKDPSKETVV
uniref:Uncharacterized protein n=1 Tax=Paramormyrops kingsleyae TaxID=1676925 RepID=A0A3B3Q4C3_9TELE